MRDLRRLEELSSTAALGLWADDIVLALDRASTAERVSQADVELLQNAADILDEARVRTAEPLSTPTSSRALAATDTALTAVALLARDHEADEQQMLAEVAQTIRRVAANEPLEPDVERLGAAMELFGLIGERQLDESNAVLASRKHTQAWTAPQRISSFS
jgi:hypothetical protein